MPRKLSVAAVLLIWSLALAAAGCGGGGDEEAATTGQATTTSASIQAPRAIEDAGRIVFCTDITYPPEEFYENGKPVGSDIDIGKDIARRMGVTARFDNTGFDAIIPALLAKKCDAIISGMNDTAERRKQVDFVDYISVGQSFMVRKGNPENVTNVASLSGKSASVEVGTTNKDFLDEQNKKLQARGKDGIKVVTFPKDTDAANALKTGRVDAYFGDSPVVAYYIARDPKSFEIAQNPTVVNPIPVGIAIRKSDAELKASVQKAIDAMYADGTMTKILKRWKMSEFALKK
ncbi:MAG: ABC transporter substrate-binding protein [Actinomycetota bacterium]|nr:ABC transporter substrate-binding protein [Actinomycetota bacterium]